jgi:hypothetical protein
MPCVPFTKRGQAENMLFNRLMIERSGNFDEQEMCLEWVNHCDGKLIFPKLPFYMQDHYKSWKQNQAAQHQVDSTNFKKGAERLKISMKTLQNHCLDRKCRCHGEWEKKL